MPSILSNDSDPDGDTISIASGDLGDVNGDGVINLNSDGTFEFAPTNNSDYTFTYQIEDGNGGTDSASVTITRTAPPPDQPSTVTISVDNCDTRGSVSTVDTTYTLVANADDPDGVPAGYNWQYDWERVSGNNFGSQMNDDDGSEYMTIDNHSALGNTTYRVSVVDVDTGDRRYSNQITMNENCGGAPGGGGPGGGGPGGGGPGGGGPGGGGPGGSGPGRT
jgi:hypothetical protein